MAMANSNEDFSAESVPKLNPDGFEQLVERNKRETMFELRQLQMGEKPVTGRDSKNKLDNFFSKRLEVASQAEHANIPLNVDRVEEHRPESVVVEVTTLFENRPVTSVLQSTTFRRQLENIVRSSISGYRRATAVAPTTRGAAPTRELAAQIPTPPPAPRLHQINEEQNVEENITDNSREVSDIPPVQRHQVESRANRATEFAISNEEWTRTVNVLENNREELVADISELVQRQLVTSTLESSTRDRLEATALSHLHSSGTDGRRVAEFISTLRSNDIIMRNDFSELGIMPPVDNSDDSLSLISATAHTVPYSQSNRALHHQMKTMKDQFDELKKMMQLSLDMQMDLQRSIRQEVAASLAAASEPVNTTQTTPNLRSYPANDDQCLICLENDADTVLYQCGHLCMCQGCAYALRERSAKCPVCRAPIKDMMRVYKCSINKS